MISVIVPVYNTRNYLDRCIQSIVSQTYKKLEILLINDCSTDGSSEILDEWEKKDSRIRVIHKEVNSGVSASRNIGLVEAKGDFIGFVDSDDWIEPDMYEQMHFWIEKTEADIALCGLRRITDKDCAAILPDKPSGSVVSPEEVLTCCIPQRDEGRYNLYIWNKLYRKQAMSENGNIPLFRQDLKYGEDVVWFVDRLLKCQKTVYWGDIGYNYLVEREGNTWTSLQAHKNYDYNESALKANHELYEMLKNAGSASQNNALQRILYYQRSAFITAYKLKDCAQFDLYSRGYLGGLLTWYMKNRTKTGLIWTMRNTKEYVRLLQKRIWKFR